MQKIFIIGGTGKVGGAAVRRLANDNSVSVTVGARDVERARAVLPDGVGVVPFDLDDREVIDTALKGQDALLLITGYSVDMLRQSKRVIDSAKEAGVSSIVHIGASANPTAEVAHWGWHRMVEAYIAENGFDYTFLHPEAFMQNLTAFGWLQEGTLTNLIGDAVWSWVDAQDVGDLAAEALRRPGDFRNQDWNLGYSAASMAEVASALSERLGQTVTLAPLSPDDFYKAAVDAGADPAYMACVRDQFHLNAAGAIKGADTVFDAAAFEAAVGRPPVTLKDHIQSMFGETPASA